MGKPFLYFFASSVVFASGLVIMRSVRPPELARVALSTNAVFDSLVHLKSNPTVLKDTYRLDLNQHRTMMTELTELKRIEKDIITKGKSLTEAERTGMEARAMEIATRYSDTIMSVTLNNNLLEAIVTKSESPIAKTAVESARSAELTSIRTESIDLAPPSGLKDAPLSQTTVKGYLGGIENQVKTQGKSGAQLFNVHAAETVKGLLSSFRAATSKTGLAVSQTDGGKSTTFSVKLSPAAAKDFNRLTHYYMTLGATPSELSRLEGILRTPSPALREAAIRGALRIMEINYEAVREQAGGRPVEELTVSERESRLRIAEGNIRNRREELFRRRGFNEQERREMDRCSFNPFARGGRRALLPQAAWGSDSLPRDPHM